MQSEIANLDFMPTRFYYLIDEEKEVVWVRAVVYGREIRS